MAADKKTLLRDALKLVQSGKIDKAVETYKAIVKVDPRDPSVHNSLGDLLIKLGKKKEAIAEYLEASALYEKDGFALRSIAICLKVVNLDTEQWTVRLKLADLYALQKLPAEARPIYLQCADHLDKRGDVTGALEIFRKIANLDPENLPVRVKLAGMFEKQKRPAMAAEEYVRAAKGYLDRKEPDTAVQLYVRAFKLAPANQEARRRLADFYAQRQDWPVVAGLLETPVAKGSQETDLLVLYAEALTKVNHPADAVKVLGQAQAREPNSVPVNIGLGRALLKLGETDKGTEALNRCVGAYLSENKLDLAEALLREMAEAAPEEEKVFQRILEVAQKRGDAGSISQAYLKIAGVHEKKGLVRSAVGALEKYLEVKPQDAAVMRRLEALKAKVPAPQAETPAAAAAVPAPAATEAPKAAAAQARPAPPPPPAEEEVVEIDLEGEDLAQVAAVAEEEEFQIEVEEAAAPAPDLAPASVAEARDAISRGAPERAAAFLEEHLGANPADIGAWSALVEARRTAGKQSEVRDALLRLADLHRRAAQFEEARAAYKGALDIDPRSALAARGLAALIMEEEAAAAPAPQESPTVQEVPAVQAAAAPEVLEIPEEEEIPEVFEIAEEEAAALEIPEEEIAETLEISEEEAAGVLEIAEEEAAEALEIAEEDAAEALEIAEEDAAEAREIPEAGEIPEVLEVVEEVVPEGPEIAEPEPPALDTREEIDLAFVGETAAEPTAVAQEGGEGVLEIPLVEEAEPEEFLSEPPPPAAAAEPPAPEPEVVPAPAPEKIAIPETGTGTGELDEFLAEADFYLQQGLLDEAEFLYTKLSRLSPGNPAIAAQLLKLQKLRPAASPPAPAPPRRRPLGEADLPVLDAELDLAFGDAAAAPPPAPPAAAVPTPAAAAAETAPGPAPAAPDYSDFLTDLRAELEGGVEVAPPAPPPEEQGLNEIFQEFQRSVKEQLGDEDYETHYNLGIAYKEMGLLSEAVAEFALAEKSPDRRMNAVSMIALCLREMGRFDESAQKLRTGISLALEGSEDQKGFLYDLAGLHEQAGRAAEAKEALERLRAMDPGYRDVAARLGAPPAPAPTRKKPKVSYL